jgi:hypothetical protein
MDEKQWLSCREPPILIDYMSANGFFHHKSAPRRRRLFGCACCLRLQRHLSKQGRKLLAIAERLAERDLTKARWKSAEEKNQISGSVNIFDAQSTMDLAAHSLLCADIKKASSGVAQYCLIAIGSEESSLGRKRKPILLEANAQADLIRDIFGIPWVVIPLKADPRWLTSNVVDLSRAIYEERAFDKMPILADALMDAGCDREEILSHCHSTAPHVRGCWVVDLLLGKS